MCETGQRLVPGAALALPSGLSVVAELAGGGFARLDTSAAPFSVFGDGLGSRLAGGDVVVATARVWKDDPKGDETARLSATGAAVLQASRDQLNTLDDPGAPLPLLERQDVQVSAVGSGRADAVVAALPLLDRFHELNPARPGRADEPATSEAHGTGARLTGPAALLAAEAATDRRFASTLDLLEATTNNAPPPPPADPAGPGPVAALLRTVASGVEGEPELHAAAALPPQASYPFDGPTAEKIAWLTALGIGALPLPADADADRRFQRFADRRVLAAIKGLSEAGEVAVKLIRPAQRFVYLESSDLTALDGEPRDPALNVRQALRDRLLANPALHVLVCLPVEPVHPYAGMRRFLTHRNNQAVAAFPCRRGACGQLLPAGQGPVRRLQSVRRRPPPAADRRDHGDRGRRRSRSRAASPSPGAASPSTRPWRWRCSTSASPASARGRCSSSASSCSPAGWVSAPRTCPPTARRWPPWSARRCRRASPATSACPSPRPATTPATASPPPTTPTAAPTPASASPPTSPPWPWTPPSATSWREAQSNREG